MTGVQTCALPISGVPFAVLRIGIDSRHGVDHVGAVRLTRESPPACFAGQSWLHRRVLFPVADAWGQSVSEKGEEEQ